MKKFRLLAAPQPHDVRQKLDLRRREVAMRPVDLAEDVPRVDEQDFVLALGLRLALVEEPQRAGQGDGVEEIRPDRDDAIDRARLDQRLADVEFVPRASAAELAMTKPARPVSLSADQNISIQR